MSFANRWLALFALIVACSALASSASPLMRRLKEDGRRLHVEVLQVPAVSQVAHSPKAALQETRKAGKGDEKKPDKKDKKDKKKKKKGKKGKKEKKPPVVLPAKRCDASFFVKGSECVDGNGMACSSWHLGVPKVQRVPYVGMLQVRTMGRTNCSGVARMLKESDMKTCKWSPSRLDAIRRDRLQGVWTKEDIATASATPAPEAFAEEGRAGKEEDDGRAGEGEEDGRPGKGAKFINPSTSGPAEWAERCCTCMEKVLAACAGEVDAECFKRQLCKSMHVDPAWKTSSACPVPLEVSDVALFERGAGRDAVASLDDAVQGKGGDTCD